MKVKKGGDDVNKAKYYGKVKFTYSLPDYMYIFWLSFRKIGDYAYQPLTPPPLYKMVGGYSKLLLTIYVAPLICIQVRSGKDKLYRRRALSLPYYK